MLGDIRRSWMRTRRLATLNRLWDLQEVGKTMLGLLDRCIHVLGNVAASAEKAAHDTGHAIEGREDLSEAMREAADLRDRVAKTWPWDERPVLPLDRTMAEASRVAQARGESRDVAEILAGLQADSVQGGLAQKPIGAADGPGLTRSLGQSCQGAPPWRSGHGA